MIIPQRERERERGWGKRKERGVNEGNMKILITFSDANDASLVITGLFRRHKFQFVSLRPLLLLRTRRTFNEMKTQRHCCNIHLLNGSSITYEAKLPIVFWRGKTLSYKSSAFRLLSLPFHLAFHVDINYHFSVCSYSAVTKKGSNPTFTNSPCVPFDCPNFPQKY